MSLQELLHQALNLKLDERALLAEQLLASLDDLKEDEVETLWADEAQSRLEDFRTGKVKAVPANEVHAKAEKLLSD